MAFADLVRPEGLRDLLAPRLPRNQNGFQAAQGNMGTVYLFDERGGFAPTPPPGPPAQDRHPRVAYHVTQRGNRRLPVFFDKPRRLFALRTIAKMA